MPTQTGEDESKADKCVDVCVPSRAANFWCC